MSLADSTVAALKAFADEVSSWTNQGSLVSIAGHIATIENAAAQDVHAGETAAKTVWAELYGAFHGHATEPIAPVAEPAPAPVAVTPVAVDPTPAPSTTPEASSAPSNTPSTSTDPATPAA